MPSHGTRSMYVATGCRCPECRFGRAGLIPVGRGGDVVGGHGYDCLLSVRTHFDASLATPADPPPPKGNQAESPDDTAGCPSLQPSSTPGHSRRRRAMSHQPLRVVRGTPATMARPCSPARRSASGSRNNASGRADSVARCNAVHRAVSETWVMTCPVPYIPCVIASTIPTAARRGSVACFSGRIGRWRRQCDYHDCNDPCVHCDASGRAFSRPPEVLLPMGPTNGDLSGVTLVGCIGGLNC